MRDNIEILQTWKLGNWLNCLVTVADPEFEFPFPAWLWLCLRGSRGGERGVVGGGRVGGGRVGGGRVCRVVGRVVRRVVVGRVVRRVVVGRVVRRVVVGRVVRRVVGGRVGFGGGRVGGGGGGLVGGGVGRVVRRVGGGGGGRVGAGTLGRNGSVTPCLPSPSILWIKKVRIQMIKRCGCGSG